LVIPYFDSFRAHTSYLILALRFTLGWTFPEPDFHHCSVITMSDDERKASATVSGKKRPRPAAAAASDDEGAAGAGASAVKAKRARSEVQGPIAPIAHPMAGKKLHKKVFKVVSKAAKAKILRRGVKEVVKAIRKGQGG